VSQKCWLLLLLGVKALFQSPIALLALVVFAAACSTNSAKSEGSGESGGSSASAGSGSSATSGASGSAGNDSAMASCANVAACGGSVLGTWTASSSCLSVSGQLSLSNFFGANCKSAPVTGTLQVSGTWTGNADGTYTDGTTTTGTEQLTLGKECLFFSGTTLTCDQVAGVLQATGYSSVTCAAADGGGCSCSATVQQKGTPGIVSSNPLTNGNFTTAGNVITIDAETSVSYCTSADKMIWTPQTQSPITTGTVLFQRGGVAGAGGALGAGGMSGAGGATNAGGSSGAGGQGTSGAGGASGTAGASGAGAVEGPCDIYAAGNTPCAAAYSTVRRLSSKYAGPLYQIRIGGSNTGTGGTLKDIGVIANGVVADGALQDNLCGSSACTISKLYDQSGLSNDLTVAGAGCYVMTPDTESNAKGRSLTIGGHKVYALYMASDSSFGSSTGPEHDGYRNNNAMGLPTGTAAESEYEIVDGKRANAGCCWDFGNAQRDSCSTGGTGAMNTVSFGAKFVWGTGAGNGPWFMMDAEGGVWAGGSGKAATQNPDNPTVTGDYAFGLVKTDTAGGMPRYAIRVGDASGGGLTTAYDGMAPATWNMQGAIVLGIGGDNSNTSYGTFFEGAVTAGRPSDATDLAVLQNVQAAGYGK